MPRGVLPRKRIPWKKSPSISRLPSCQLLWPTAAIDAVRRPLARPVHMKGVAHGLRPYAERLRNQVDARAGVGHLNDLGASSPRISACVAAELRRCGGRGAPFQALSNGHHVGTPRGPSMEIRPSPEQCRQWAEEVGFRFVRYEPGIARWHWGLLMQRG
jgi:hypothetical protein